MAQLPVITGFGGYNAAGRSSFHHGFRRMVLESLEGEARQQTIAGLGVMAGLIQGRAEGFTDLQGRALSLSEVEAQFGAAILESTLVRKVEPRYFDVDKTPWQQSLTVATADHSSQFLVSKKQLPEPVPAAWQVKDHSDTHVQVTLVDNLNVKIPSTRDFPIKSAGQLPSGFEPADLYDARFHPRGLQLTVVGMSDALHSLGIPWHTVRNAVKPDQIAVYASSMLGQMDEHGYTGMIQARQKGGRVTAKELPLGLNSMPADFINAYILGHVGTTGAMTGACATFLYNLRLAVDEIKSGRARVAIVGNAEAPITPEVMEGFAAMSALASKAGLSKLDQVAEPVYRKSSRPFGENCGFTIAESAQFVILMDDALAMQLGAQVYGAVSDVFVNADGHKKSISAPGAGNYLTLVRAVAAARALVGDEGIRERSFVHAHGSSTPANRVTESALLNQVAASFGISRWPVTAVKAYLGHSLGPASGDQLASALGSFRYGIIPGIKTISAVAEDVHQEHLLIPTEDLGCGEKGLDVAFINSKGFGGNNATGVVLSPQFVLRLLRNRYGEAEFARFLTRQQHTIAQAARYDQAALRGDFQVEYHFGAHMIDEGDLKITQDQVQVPGFAQPIDLTVVSEFADMLRSPCER
ncbi:Beta-ketoacyl synthase [gamma proteobacterium HdN1]|nr:Beta-ketoacyl synthase [gamma proteobacterium HdN1]